MIRTRQTEKSADIETPVWSGPLRFHTGGIVKFRGPMESNKTRSMIAILFRVIKQQGFRNDRVFANCWIDLPGSHWLRNDELRKVIRRAFNTEFGAGRWSRCIFLIMDCDDVYSHITQSDKECFQDLKRASQAYKRNMFLFYEVHDGLSVPKYLRDKTEVSIAPKPDDARDHVDLYIADRHYNQVYIMPIDRISAVNNRYRRFEDNY